MTPERLASLAAYAGERLHPDGPTGPHPFGAGVQARTRKAVYIVCAWSGCVLYVGSTTAGVDTRFAQHLRDLTKTLDWATAYIVPLVKETPTCDVRRIEGRIGLAVAPIRNKALPQLRFPRTLQHDQHVK